MNLGTSCTICANRRSYEARDVVFMEDQTIEDIRAQTMATPSQPEDEVFHDANSNWQCEEHVQGDQPARADEGKGDRSEPRAQPLKRSEWILRLPDRYVPDLFAMTVEEGEPQSMWRP